MLLIKVIFHYNYCVNIIELGLFAWKFTVDSVKSSLILFKKGGKGRGMIHFDLILIYQVFENGF